jgi:serpin B
MMLMEKPNSTLYATESINALGIDLLRRLNKPSANTLLSPYSIQCVFVQAYAGAEGETKIEMGRVLHYPSDEVDIHVCFAALRQRKE